MTQPSSSKSLRAAIQSRVVPWLGEHGFTQTPAPPDDSGETLSFRRTRNHGIELLDIQFDKRGRPSFVVEFGRVPSPGVDLQGTHIEPAQCQLFMLERRARLYQKPVSKQWFKIPAWKRLAGAAAAERVADAVLAFLPQVEAWFATDAAGPNIQPMHVPVNPPTTGRKFPKERIH